MKTQRMEPSLDFYQRSTLYILYAICYFAVQPGDGLDITKTRNCKVSAVIKQIVQEFPEFSVVFQMQKEGKGMATQRLCGFN
jgi:hypothetical protein